MPKKYSGSKRKTKIIFFFFKSFFFSPSRQKSWQKAHRSYKRPSCNIACSQPATTEMTPSSVRDLPEGMSEDRWISMVVFPHLWLSRLQYCIYFWRETRCVSPTASLCLTHVHYLNLRSAPTRESSKYDLAQVLKIKIKIKKQQKWGKPEGLRQRKAGSWGGVYLPHILFALPILERFFFFFRGHQALFHKERDKK